MAGAQPLLSVVMPVFNAESYVAEAVQSVLNQTYKDFELIIIDDGSTDRSCAVLNAAASSDSRIILRTQTNAGLIASLSRGCGLARGTYIARMDADDISMPARFQKQIAFLERHKTVGIVGTWVQDIGAAGQTGPIWPLPTSPGTIPWFLMFGNCMAHPSVMMRREVIQNLGYRSDAEHVEDYDLWIRASTVTRLANIPEVLLKYRVSGQSVSSRHLSAQEEAAAKLQHFVRKEILGDSACNVELLTADLLLKLFFAYRQKYGPGRGDESEIVLDIFRRLYLAGDLRRAPVPLVRLLPKLLSFQAFGKMLRYGGSYAPYLHQGFTTQRLIPE